MKLILLIILFLSASVFSQTHTIWHDFNQLEIADDGAYQSVTYHGELNLSQLDDEAGQPDLPVYMYKIVLEPSMTVESFVIKNLNERTLDGSYLIKPQQEPWYQDYVDTGEQISPEYPEIRYPEESVRFLGVKYFNGIPIAHFAIHPVKYSVADRKLIFIESLDLVIGTMSDANEGIQPKKEFQKENQKLVSLVDRSQARTIEAFPTSVSGWTPDEYGVPLSYLNAGLVDRYIIITTGALAQSFQPLADWKTRKGVPTIIRTMSWVRENFPHGVDDAERLRNFIRWSYQNRGTKYVLLGGETELVPSRIIKTGGFTFPADYYYSDLDGTWNADQDEFFGEAVDLLDGYPEVYVSRIPAEQPADVTRFIDRLFQYEKMQNIENPNFPVDVLYTAANLSKDGDGKELILKHIDPEINPSFQRTMITETDNIGADPAPALAELNKNYALIFTEGHGLYHTVRPGARGSNLFSYMIEGLTNNDPGIWYVASCWTNDIVKRSFSETFLLAENGGGVAYIGNSSYEYPFSGVYLQKEFYNLAFSQGRYHLAEAHYLSRLKYLGYLSWEGPSRIIVYSTIVLGDAEMPIWTEMPKPLEVTYSTSDNEAGYKLQVDVKEAGSSQNLPNATVVLYREDEIFHIVKTNGHGIAEFDLGNYLSGPVSLTVTKHNFIPFEGNMEIVPEANPRIILDSIAFAEIDGNNNEQCEPGEQLTITISLTNTGTETISNGLQINFFGEDSLLTLDTNFVTIPGTIQPQETVNLPAIGFWVNSEVSRDTTLLLEMAVLSGTRSFGRIPLEVPVRTPKLIIGDYQIITTPDYPAEHTRLELALDNIGPGGARDIFVILRNDQPWIQVIDSVSYFGTINAGASALSDPGFNFDHEGALDSAIFELEITDFYGYTRNLTLDFNDPVPPAQVSFFPVSPNSIELRWAASTASDVTGYEIFRSISNENEFVKISELPVKNAGYYVDSDVENNQSYQYLIRAIDASGNKSAFSPDTVSAWPGASEQANFPISIGVRAIGSDMNGLIVHDFNHDPAQEIVASGAHGVLKILNSRGQTLHALTSLRGNLTIPAAGNVFGDAALEIVVSSKEERTENNYIYVIDPITGTIIHELPLGYHVPGSVMLNDLDHDGYDEIMVLTHANNAPVPPRNSRLIIRGYNGSEWGPFRNWTDNGYSFEYTYSLGMPASGSLSNNDTINVIVGTAEGKVYAFNPLRTAEPVWIRTLPGILSAPLSLADADQDGRLEILVAAVNQDQLYLLDDDGSDFPGWEGGKAIDIANPWYAGSPAIFANVDDDPEPEIIYVGRDSVHIFNADATEKPGWPVPIENGDNFYDSQHGELSVSGSPVVADLDQNGRLEIISITTDGLIHALDTETGKEITGFPVNTHNDEVSGHTPFVTDLDNDNDFEVIFIGHGGVVHVWDLPHKYIGESRLLWNQAFGNLRHTGELDTTLIGLPSAMEEILRAGIPHDYFLNQNYPNPFNPHTTIEFGLSAAARVELSIYNILGQKITTILASQLPAGNHQARWDGKNKQGNPLSSGVYFYRLEIKNSSTGQARFSKQGKMILLK